MANDDPVELIKSLYAAFGRGDIPLILSRLSPTVQWVQPGGGTLPWGGEWSGAEQVGHFFTTLGSEVDYQSFEPLEFVTNDQTVVVRGQSRASVRKTGVLVEQSWVMIWRVAGGAIAAYEYWDDTARWAAALEG